MFYFKNIIIFFICIGSFTSSANAQKSEALEGLVKQIIQPYLDEKDTYGLSVGIIDDGFTYEYHYGNLSKDQVEPPNTQTLYHVGSITKVLTTSLLKILEAEGILSAQDPITQYLPDSIGQRNPRLADISLYHLATHTSGLPKEPYNKVETLIERDNPYAHYQIKDVYRYLLMHQHPDYFLSKKKRAKRFRYSHFGIGLLGHLLENATQKDYETLLETYISQPLALGNIRIFLDDTLKNRLAKGHSYGGQTIKEQHYASLYSSEGLKATLKDMLTFTAANMEDSLLNPIQENLKKCHEAQHKTQMQYVKVAYGWYVFKFGKNAPYSIVTHSGRTAGYSCFIAFIEQMQVAVVVLSNAAFRVDETGIQILELLMR